GDSQPDSLLIANNILFFSADDGVHGNEPWVMPLQGSTAAATIPVLALSSRTPVAPAEIRPSSGAGNVGGLATSRQAALASSSVQLPENEHESGQPAACHHLSITTPDDWISLALDHFLNELQ